MAPKSVVDDLEPPQPPHENNSKGANDCIEDDPVPDLTMDSSTSGDIPLTLMVLGIFGKEERKVGQEYVALKRYRLNTSNPKGERCDPVRFVPTEGLTHADRYHLFYHNCMDGDGTKNGKMGDRAVMFQSIENYEHVSREPTLAKYFHLHDKNIPQHEPLTLTDQELLTERTLDDIRFGEQVVVQGATPDDVAIGDIFEVAHGESKLKLQVTCPRKPCFYVDVKNETPKGLMGIKSYSLPKGLAGWFTRVLVAGELRDGMTLMRTDRLYPTWTLANISQALFGGEGDPKALLRSSASWGRSKQELQELIDMGTDLCDYEWGCELTKLMAGIEEDTVDQKDQNGIFLNYVSYYFSGVMDFLCSMQALGCFDDEMACGALQCSV